MKSEAQFARDAVGPAALSRKGTLSWEIFEEGGAIVLHCQGRLIVRSEAHALAETVSEILPVTRRMVVDLAGVQAVDSAGLGELVLLHMWAQQGGYELKFSAAKSSVRQVLELTNLTSIFDLHASVPDAIAAMQDSDASD